MIRFNLLAYVALVGFIPLAVAIFARLPRATATATTVLAGSLFLPEFLAFDFVGLPPLDKDNITYLGALAGALAYRSRSLSAARPGLGADLIVGLILIANVATIASNPGAMRDEGTVEPGLNAYDAVSMSADVLFRFGVPFFLGRSMFSTREDLRTLLVLLAGAGLIYAVLISIEVVLSIPWRVFHLNRLIYGIAKEASFRWGQVQPAVFLEHGLSVALFMATALLAAVGLAAARMRVFHVAAKVSCSVLFVALVLCRNVAGVVYGGTLSLSVAMLRPSHVARISVLLATLVCVYPALRSAGLFPYQQILDLAGEFDQGRRDSLFGRFHEEEYILDLMGNRIWFGWGNIARVPGAQGGNAGTEGGFEGGLDGYWVIVLGTHGAVGLELRLALLTLPVLLAWRTLRRMRSAREKTLLVALMAIVAMRCVDLLPNGWWNNLPVFLAGALYSFSRSLGNQRTSPLRETIEYRESPSYSAPISERSRSAMNRYPSTLK